MYTKKGKAHLEPKGTPTDMDVAWAAGIYEGEGSCQQHGKNKKSFQVSVFQKEPELLYRLRDWFGGSVIFYDGVGPNKRFSVYAWRACGDRGRVFIAAVYPFLTARRRSQVDETTGLKFLSHESQIITAQTAATIVPDLREKLEAYNGGNAVDQAEKRKEQLQGWYAKNKLDPNWIERQKVVRKQRKLKILEMKATA